MRITAAEVMEKRAVPGHPAAGQPRPRPQARPQGPSMAPQAPEEPQQAGGDPAAAAGGMPGEDPTQQQQGDGHQDLQRLTQQLLSDMFDDGRISQTSQQIEKLIPLVGPEHAEKFVKVYSDWIKAAMVMKANLMSMVVMATPAQTMQNQVNMLMKQLTQSAGQTVPGGAGGAPGAAGGGGGQLKVPIT